MVKVKRVRPTYFVCSCIIDNGELKNKIISAAAPNEAADLFIKEFGKKPREILGPFYKKRTHELEINRNIKLSAVQKKAEYNGWIVNAFFLIEPEDHAFLIFINRIDNKPIPKPTGTIITAINNLRIINV